MFVEKLELFYQQKQIQVFVKQISLEVMVKRGITRIHLTLANRLKTTFNGMRRHFG